MMFTGQDAATAQTALRAALGLAPEQFPAEAFIGMISDEIEQLREQGRDDGAIAHLISQITGKDISPALIAEHYATPQQRGHHGGA